MQNITTRLPFGEYQCRVLGRQSIQVPSASGEARSTLELHVIVSSGPHSGHQLSFRVWGEGKTQRARSLRRDEPLIVNVAHVRLESGAIVHRVVDFRTPSAACVLDDSGCGATTTATDEACSGGLPLVQSAPDLHDRLRGALTDTSTEPAPVVTTAPCPAFAAEFATGFHWLGAKSGQRSLIDYKHVFEQHAAMAATVHAGAPGFLSLCQYSCDIEAHAKAHGGSLAGYRGCSWARWLAIDLDGDRTDAGLNRVIDESVRVTGALVALGVPAESILVFFSGGRGIHIMWPSSVVGASPVDGFEMIAGRVCQTIADLVGVAIDMNVYKPLAALRAPNTRHEESGLYKIALALDELATLDAAGIRELSRAPRPFVVPAWSFSPVPLLQGLWAWASQAAVVVRRKATAVASGDRRIFGDTFDLMVHGAADGSRGMRFFKAAMNLLDFGCPEPLLHALLEPAARLSGYPQNEFASQIDGALKAHAERGTTQLT